MNSVEGKKILITGGAGFIGSATADQLLGAGAAEVRVLDNFVRGSMRNLEGENKRTNLVVIEGDIRDEALVNEVTDGVDYVFHLAALRITRCAEAPREAVQVLINGTSNVLESAVRYKVKKIVVASSASVYGDPSYLPMDEGHPFNNRTLYGAGKIANEQMLRSYYEMFKLPYVAFRYFNVYGPRMDLDGVYTEVLIRWMDAIEAGQSPKIFGDGLQSMDFVYVEDVARANIAGLMSDVTDEVFNVGMGVETTLNELCRQLLKITGSNLEPEYHETRKVNNVRARRATTEKAEKMIGFRGSVPLEEGLRRLVEWRNQMKTELVATVRSSK
jgi:UDP-glucose 4-epimerase